jgi:hypothetical protein
MISKILYESHFPDFCCKIFQKITKCDKCNGQCEPCYTIEFKPTLEITQSLIYFHFIIYFLNYHFKEHNFREKKSEMSSMVSLNNIEHLELQRDSWMEAPMDLIPTITRKEIRDAKKAENPEEEKKMSMDKVGTDYKNSQSVHRLPVFPDIQQSEVMSDSGMCCDIILFRDQHLFLSNFYPLCELSEFEFLVGAT